MTSPPSDWRSVLLIRHGATALNSNDHTKDRIRGWTDYPLSSHGEWEAHKLATKIAGKLLRVLFHSDLTRSTQTAKIINQILDIPVEDSGMDFRPWNVGDFVGRQSAEVIPILARYAVESHKPVPGGESFDTFRNRFFNGLLRALHNHEGLVGIVTHHRCERLLKAWAKASFPENGQIDLDEFTLKGDPTGHCEIIQIPLNRLELYSNWVHLQHRNFHDSDLAMITLQEKGLLER